MNANKTPAMAGAEVTRLNLLGNSHRLIAYSENAF
jgi:hypothetical protein